MSGKFNTALNTVTDKINEAFHGVEVKSHPGRFTEEELGRLVRQKSSILVAIEDIPSFSATGDGVSEADVLFVAFVVCADKSGADRHTSAIDIVEELISLVSFNRWGSDKKFKAATPANISADNLYSGEIEKKGVAMWAVSWRQTIR